uniref:Lipoprotein n=1 Tax=viral metagenome TaxID=1070528 RepID=A0A6M3JSP2_9ZZZZ
MKILIFIFSILLLAGCATHISDLSKSYSEHSVAVQEFASITIKDWDFGTGMILGAVGESNLPSWIPDAFDQVSKWIEDSNGELSNRQLGYSFGLRFRLANPIIKSMIELYAPQILNIPEVVSVFSFLGI